MTLHPLNGRRRNLGILLLSLWLFSLPAPASHGPEGGAWGISIHPFDRNVIYSGASGVHQSTDGGETWQRLSEPINFSVLQVFISPDNPSVMFADAGIYPSGPPTEAGVFRSTDGGKQWSLVLQDGYSPQTHPTDPTIIYALKDRRAGVFKTTDGGDTWRPIGLEGLFIISLAIHPVETDTLYIGGRGVRRSTDGGQTWELRGSAEASVSPLFLDPTEPDTLYGWGGVTLKSTDGGRTWQPISALSGTVAVDPTDPRIIFLAAMTGDLSERGIYKSTDAGGSWKKVVNYFPVGNIVMDPDDTRMVYAGGVTGIAKSTDAGETWTVHSRGLNTMNVGLALIAPSDSNILYATGSNSKDAGEIGLNDYLGLCRP
ncbi:MAG: hypothetical protein HYR55_02400 [Acidobacteria bacterium]|nr:hypothetical protein [Acidobacteriota bacterium]